MHPHPTLTVVVALSLFALMLPAVAGHQLPQHWVKRSPQAVEVLLIDHTSGRYPVAQAVQQWNQSSSIGIRQVDDCPPNRGCINVHLRSMDYLGLTTLYAHEDRHLYAARVDLNADRDLSPMKRLSLACHELGHGLGLGHRSDGDTCMVNSDAFPTQPDTHDYRDLDDAYSHQH